MRPPQVIADSNVIIARLITLFAASVDIKLLTQEQRAIAHAATRMVEEHLAQTGFYYRYGKLAHAVHMVTCTSTHAHACVYHSEREAVRRYPWSLPCACRPPHAGVLRRSLGLLTPSLAVEPCALKHKATHVHVLAPASQGCMKRGSSGCPRPDSVPRLSTRASCFAQVEDRLFNGLPRGRGWRAYQPAATLKIIAARRLASPQGHSDEELWGFANDDLAALEALLGGRDFFFGAHASALDCAVFGQLIQFMDIPMSFPQQASTSNLVFRVSCCLTQLATRWPWIQERVWAANIGADRWSKYHTRGRGGKSHAQPFSARSSRLLTISCTG